MSAGFTPGPWEAITDADVPDVVCNGGKDSIFYINGEEGNANARLIAAAPELYEAVVVLTQRIAEEQFLTNDDAIWGAFTRSVAALVKARGGA